MRIRLTALCGIFSSILFFMGLIFFFFFNPQAYKEINNLSLASYNIDGLNSRLWVASITYCVSGLLNIIFFIGLLTDFSKGTSSLLGKIPLLICGIIWFSFGVFFYYPDSAIGNHFMVIRLVLFIILSFIGLFFLGTEYERISVDKFMKIFTVLSSLLILILGFLSTFVYNDNTWIRTNFSLFIYFIWFVVFGLRFLIPRRVSRFGDSVGVEQKN